VSLFYYDPSGQGELRMLIKRQFGRGLKHLLGT